MLRSGIVISIMCIALGCSSTRALPPIPRADEIRVRGLTEELSRVDDADRIRQVISIANQNPEGWDIPSYGPPVARTNLVFYADGEAVADLGIGDTFLTRTHGNFYSRVVDASDLEKIRSALNVGNPYTE